MNITHRIAAAAVTVAAAAALSGCATEVVGEAVPAPPTTEAPVGPLPAAPDAPREFDEIGAQAFVDTVREEGIPFGSEADLLALGRIACPHLVGHPPSIVDAIATFENAGYATDDAGFMAGAATVMCSWEQGGDI
ncbi:MULTISPECIES: DUF732 domain-containing protein [Prauserella salsuginis group]|uniref:DUF732 domain-containing protein n=2 Tax=Prauserella salsuginis group TaxID=2893672 RepID=A0A839Y112_9PSEU|nr:MULTISPECIES: DUF732 domain-containing protein [Prauserella salsuginis group]MBB3666383.1 hypothetical protein [Prauserella sediminis]MCR3719172.1 Protein of unknown function (DUF732) [Prauserella flava]MCR3735815.1 Protein of unknown function (DUF732) [Prauserella salsuginis]